MTLGWVHLVVAPDQLTADFWIQILGDEGIAAMIHPADAVSFLGVSGFGCRIQVRECDLEQAGEIIAGLQSSPDEE